MKHLAVEHSVVMAFVKRDTEDISTLKEVEENGDESEKTKCLSSEEQKNNGDSEKDENSKSGSFVKWADDDDAATAADETGETATESGQKATVSDVRRILDSDSESEADQ